MQKSLISTTVKVTQGGKKRPNQTNRTTIKTKQTNKKRAHLLPSIYHLSLVLCNPLRVPLHAKGDLTKYPSSPPMEERAVLIFPSLWSSLEEYDVLFMVGFLPPQP